MVVGLTSMALEPAASVRLLGEGAPCVWGEYRNAVAVYPETRSGQVAAVLGRSDQPRLVLDRFPYACRCSGSAVELVSLFIRRSFYMNGASRARVIEQYPHRHGGIPNKANTGE